MNGLYAAAVTVCSAALICALVSNFVSDASSQKLISLVMGAFVVCVMVAPVRAAVQEAGSAFSQLPQYEEKVAQSQEQSQKQILAATRDNLERTLQALLQQNGLACEKTEIILADSGENGIIIARASIYIDRNSEYNRAALIRVTEQHFGITPEIILSGEQNE